MKVGKHTAFMMDFLSDFADGKMSRDHFEMDYSGYVIEHFPMMERENPILAQKFADTVDCVSVNTSAQIPSVPEGSTQAAWIRSVAIW